MICALSRVELFYLIADAPRRWRELGSPLDRRGVGIAVRQFWHAEAEQITGCAVVLECGDANEVWVICRFTGEDTERRHG